MKFFIKFVYIFTLGFGLIFLNACFDNESANKQSFDEGPESLDVNVEVDNEGVPSDLKLRAAPQINSVNLDWDPVSNALDYRVSRQIEGGDAIVTLTGGSTSFSFDAQEGSTYTVSVAATDATGQVISMSKLITVKTSTSDALKMSDEGL